MSRLPSCHPTVLCSHFCGCPEPTEAAARWLRQRLASSHAPRLPPSRCRSAGVCLFQCGVCWSLTAVGRFSRASFLLPEPLAHRPLLMSAGARRVLRVLARALRPRCAPSPLGPDIRSSLDAGPLGQTPGLSGVPVTLSESPASPQLLGSTTQRRGGKRSRRGAASRRRRHVTCHSTETRSCSRKHHIHV